jgi:hypothetical protein
MKRVSFKRTNEWVLLYQYTAELCVGATSRMLVDINRVLCLSANEADERVLLYQYTAELCVGATSRMLVDINRVLCLSANEANERGFALSIHSRALCRSNITNVGRH